MKHWKRMLALFAAVGISVLGLFGAGVPTFAESAANTYYISSSTGDDRADGRTPETAWKTFQNVNAKKLSAGERVLLKRGMSSMSGSRFSGRVRRTPGLKFRRTARVKNL